MNRRREEKSMERRNGGGNCQADMDGWKKGRGQACRYREGERREKKQQRKGREVVHFCFGRQLTAGKLVKMEAGERERGVISGILSAGTTVRSRREKCPSSINQFLALSGQGNIMRLLNDLFKHFADV